MQHSEWVCLVFVCVCVCVHAHARVCVCVHGCVGACVWACMHVCVGVYVHDLFIINGSTLLLLFTSFYFCFCYVTIVSCIFGQNKRGGVAETPTRCSVATRSCPSWWMSWWSLWDCRTFTTPSRSSSTRSVVLLIITLMLLQDLLRAHPRGLPSTRSVVLLTVTLMLLYDSLWACSQGLHWPGQWFCW